MIATHLLKQVQIYAIVFSSSTRGGCWKPVRLPNWKRSISGASVCRWRLI